MPNTAEYYNSTASTYDDLHDAEPEHTLALELGWPLLNAPRSVLDVGCGTARSLSWIKQRQSATTLHGIDPSRGMLNLAMKRIPEAEFREGSAETLPYASSSFDAVVATGIMHHVDDPAKAIAEMFRVARHAVLISDHNNFAFGGPTLKRARMGLKMLGLLSFVTYVKQGFNRRGYSEDDGWWYPYSLLENYEQIARASKAVYIFPTRPPSHGGNFVFSQSHIAVVAFKP